MSVRVLFLAYTRELVWPVVVVVALFLFRFEIRKAMGRLSELQLPGGASMKFIDERVKLIDRFSTATSVNLDEKARQANMSQFAEVERRYAELTALASREPREAVLRSWASLTEFAHVQGRPTGTAASLEDLVPQLVRPASVPMCSETIRALSETYGEIISGWSQITTTGATHFVHAVQRVAVEILAGTRPSELARTSL